MLLVIQLNKIAFLMQDILIQFNVASKCHALIHIYYKSIYYGH